MKTSATIAESAANGKHAATASAKAISEGVSQELHNFIADIEDLIKTTTALSNDDLAKVKSSISERVTAAKESIQEISSNIDHQAREAATNTDNYVHEQPWKSIGLGAAAGLLLGFVISHRAKATA